MVSPEAHPTLVIFAAWLLSISTTRVVVTSVAMTGLALAVLTALVRPNRTAALLAIAGVALGTAWVLAWGAERTDFHDADGWADCWPSCSAVQTATGATLTYGTLVLAAVGLVSVASLVRRYRRTR
jgi:hypothetical protein